MKKNTDFMRFYDESVDTVFSYYYEKTHDHDTSLGLTKTEFEKAWDKFTQGMEIDSVIEGREPFKGTNTMGPKSGTAPFIGSTDTHQYGY